MQAPANLPPPIRTDGSNMFAYYTMYQRQPTMLTQILDNNPDYADNIREELELLRVDLIQNNPILPLNLFPSPPPDYTDWTTALLERGNYNDPNTRATWLNTDWFFAETVLFRMVIEATRWWETQRDPFAPIKQRELDSPALWELLERALRLNGGVIDRIPELLKMATWGNRMDLSHTEAASIGAHDVAADDLLADDSTAAREYLLRAQLAGFPDEQQGVAHVILDNTGTELAMDLALVDALLSGISDVVVLHVKYHPTFVSDATAADVLYFIERCANGKHGKSPQPVILNMGLRLQAAFNSGRLRIAPNLFWNSSLFLWQMPRTLERVFAGAQLVVLKGDANYRRAVGDALWNPSTPFNEVLSYFPSAVLALRTLKSDPIIGLQPEQPSQLDSTTRQWRTSGQYGVIQLRAPNP